MHTWYHLDPDNRKDPPKSGTFCSRCMYPVQFKNAYPIVLHNDEPWFRLLGITDIESFSELLGPECYKRLVVESNIVKID